MTIQMTHASLSSIGGFGLVSAPCDRKDERPGVTATGDGMLRVE